MAHKKSSIILTCEAAEATGFKVSLLLKQNLPQVIKNTRVKQPPLALERCHGSAAAFGSVILVSLVHKKTGSARC